MERLSHLRYVEVISQICTIDFLVLTIMSFLLLVEKVLLHCESSHILQFLTSYSRFPDSLIFMEELTSQESIILLHKVTTYITIL